MTRPADNRSGGEHSGRHEPVEAIEPATGELLGVVEPYTGSLDQEGFHGRCVRFGSVREMTRSLLGGRPAGRRGEEERLSNALRALWERWAPDEPFFERFDDAMLRGWQADDRVEKCEIWLEAWRDIVRIADRLALATIEEIDNRFQGREHVYNWVQDLETELLNAGIDDPRFLRECIRFCKELPARFPGADRLMVENLRRSSAECHFRLGETETGDRLYRRWLDADPAWGWGWIGWSDAYGFLADPSGQDFARAAEILEQGLAVDGLRDRSDLLDRSAEVYDELGRDEDARRVRGELRKRNASAPSGVWGAQSGMQVGQAIGFGEPGLPLEFLPDFKSALTGRPATATSRKIGRNEPCPCGSGTKYKKCCGRAR